MEENRKKTWKLHKKIEKRHGNYERKISWIVKRYGKCGRKVGELWNYMEIWKKGKLNSEKIEKLWKKSK
jgi:hypothetical protein